MRPIARSVSLGLGIEMSQRFFHGCPEWIDALDGTIHTAKLARLVRGFISARRGPMIITLA